MTVEDEQEENDCPINNFKHTKRGTRYRASSQFAKIDQVSCMIFRERCAAQLRDQLKEFMLEKLLLYCYTSCKRNN